MLTFHVITLFPELIAEYCSVSIVSRGIAAQKIAVKAYNPREFCLDKYRKVDDTPYGGGAGMVLKPEPIFAAFESIQRKPDSPVLLMSPQGEPLKQEHCLRFSNEVDVTLICGHYEGFDERIRTLATQEISLGDYVLTGGELPALAIVDSVARLIPGVIGKSISLAHESFHNEQLLEWPQYTKPSVFRDMPVPDVLLSGNHREVSRWRRQQALKRTLEWRPDLLEKATLDVEDKRYLDSLTRKQD